MSLKDYNCVKKWLSRVGRKTGRDNFNSFRRWINWLRERGLDYGPDDLLRIQREKGGYEVLDLVQEYVRSLDLRESSLRRYYASLRSFFLHNRVPLPLDPSFQIRSDKPRVVGRLTVEDFKYFIASSNRLYRAVFMCMFQGGMGLNEVVYWSNNGWESLKSQLDRDVHPVKVDLPGRKSRRNKKPYYTFIGRDARDGLEDYLEVRPPESKSIFVNQYGRPLTKQIIYLYWLRHMKKIGLIKFQGSSSGNRSGRNPHELRDLFKSRFEKSGASNNASEFFLGHVIDPQEYNKAFRDVDYARRQYRKALPWLNILSGDPEKVPLDSLEEEREGIRREFEEKYREQLERMRELAKRVDRLARMLEEKEKP